MAENESNSQVGPVWRLVGGSALFLRKFWILTVVTLAGGVVAATGPLLLTDPGWTPIRVGAGVAAVLAVLADRIADFYDKKLSVLTFRESERSAERAVDNLNVLVSESIEAMFLEGKSREDAIRALRRTAVRCAAGAIGDDSRATHYSLRREPGGSRILDQATHATGSGRYDTPNRPFIEREDPQHDIWRLLERTDEEAEVRGESESVYGVDWAKKKYKTFLSVPVKANSAQLGLLSVNHAKDGAIGGPQRSAILAMARTLALVASAQAGPRKMQEKARLAEMSVVGATLAPETRDGDIA